MSNYKKDQRDKEFDAKAAKDNQNLKSKHSDKPNIFRKIYLWFIPVEGERLLKEAVTNWMILLSPLMVIVMFTVGKHQVNNQSSDSSLGATMIFTMFFVFMSFGFWIYKGILTRRKKKGKYFTEYKKKK